MTLLPPNIFDSGCPGVQSDEAVAFADSQAPDATADISELACSSVVERGAVNACVAGSNPAMPAIDLPDDLKQRFLAAIADDYRFAFDEARFMADMYAPPKIRVDSFEDSMAMLDELIDAQPLPIFMKRTA